MCEYAIIRSTALYSHLKTIKIKKKNWRNKRFINFK